MQLRRIPAQRFLVFLLLGPDKLDDDAVLDELDRLGLIRPTRRELARTRRELAPPRGFDPSRPNQAALMFLQKLGISGLFWPTPAVKEAFGICRNARLQEYVEVLLLNGASPSMVVEGVAARMQHQVSEDGVVLYSKLFFDIADMDSADVRQLMLRRLRQHGGGDPSQDARCSAAAMPRSYCGALLSQLRSGALPRAIDHVRLLETARGVLAARVVEAAVRGSHRDAQSAGQFASALKTLHELLESSRDPHAGIVRAVGRVKLIASDQQMPFIDDVTGGNHSTDLQPDEHHRDGVVGGERADATG